MYHIIVNPASRSGKGLKIFQETIEPILHKEQVPFCVYFSKKQGDVALLAKDITANTTDIVKLAVIGGDGTINEALQGIKDFTKVHIGYIPTGSSNDLARDLKIDTNPAASVRRVFLEENIRKVDLGCVSYPDGTSRYFIVSCGIGFDAAVCEEALHSGLKNFFNKIGLGKLTYLGIALKQLFTAKPASCILTLDDAEPIHINKVLFVAIMSHRFEGGGFMFCPDAVANDGILNLCAVGDIKKSVILVALPTAFKGKHYKVKGITPYKAKTIKVKTSIPLWLHTDGEVLRKTQEFTVTCKKEQISLL
ncbi:YegS/Rv2252/BmrU family lipid kinase [Lachnospiraceae bacterium OttesenSCG-928-D06]|nr:YegS/Rv2252/BmrU family lipid kinase [Lachnospiraceae bacterium OttesenSCG-928-D06]